MKFGDDRFKQSGTPRPPFSEAKAKRMISRAIREAESLPVDFDAIDRSLTERVEKKEIFAAAQAAKLLASPDLMKAIRTTLGSYNLPHAEVDAIAFAHQLSGVLAKLSVFQRPAQTREEFQNVLELSVLTRLEERQPVTIPQKEKANELLEKFGLSTMRVILALGQKKA